MAEQDPCILSRPVFFFIWHSPYQALPVWHFLIRYCQVISFQQARPQVAIIMFFEGLDTSTVQLIVKIYLDDLKTQEGTRKGKHREDETPDLDVAMQFFKHELMSLAQFSSDRSVCLSIAMAVTRDADLIEAYVKEEQETSRDRALAVSLASGNGSTPADDMKTPKPALDEELLKKLEAIYVSNPDDQLGHAESSSWAAGRQKSQVNGDEEPLKRDCISCGEKHLFFEVARCPCSHEYCLTCLETLFRLSMGDESLFPPRCCTIPIPIESARMFLPSALVGEFMDKRVELETADRTYCHHPACSRFIGKDFIQGDVGTCRSCWRETCTLCKKAAHESDCPQDAALQELLQVVAEKGWQRCYACHRVVELDYGCNHISKLTLSLPLGMVVHSTDTHLPLQHVCVVPNSATYAEPGGEPADVTSGMKSDLFGAPTPFSTEGPRGLPTEWREKNFSQGSDIT